MLRTPDTDERPNPFEPPTATTATASQLPRLPVELEVALIILVLTHPSKVRASHLLWALSAIPRCAQWLADSGIEPEKIAENAAATVFSLPEVEGLQFAAAAEELLVRSSRDGTVDPVQLLANMANPPLWRRIVARLRGSTVDGQVMLWMAGGLTGLPPTQVQPRSALERGKLAVVLHNDDKTQMFHVVESLRAVGLPLHRAVNVMLTTHELGEAEVGVWSPEVATAVKTTLLERARAKGFPLHAETRRWRDAEGG